MDNSLLYMYILMILALLIGFFIGWILRRSTYRRRYEDKIYELQYLEEEKFEQLTRAESNLRNLHDLHLDNKDNFRIKSKRLESHVEQDKRLKAEIDETRSQNEAWAKNTPIVDEKIDDALEYLSKLKSAKEQFITQIEELNGYEHDIVDLNGDIERIKLLLTPALERKSELQQGLEGLMKRIEEQQNQLDRLDSNTVESKDEYARKKTTLEKELLLSQEEEKKYSLMLEKIENKIINSQELSSSDFKEMSQDGGGSVNWISGFYEKSKNLFKGEK